MKRIALLALFIAFIVSGHRLGAEAAASPRVVRLDSPGGTVRIEMALERDGQTEAVPQWRVFFKGHPIVLNSRLGIETPDGALGGACVIESTTTRSIREPYTIVVGKRHDAVDHCQEAVISLREQAAPGRR